MRGLGTIINVLAIIAGGVLGIVCKRFLKERYQETIMKSTGISVVFLGAAGMLTKMLVVSPEGSLSMQGSMVMILSLAIGVLVGEIINIDAQFERFGEWLKHKTGSDGDYTTLVAMVQLMPEKYRDVEILLDYETEKVITLGELTPEWWI